MTTTSRFPKHLDYKERLSLVTLVALIFCSCTAPNPDFSEEAVLAEGMIDVSGGDEGSSGTTAGGTTAGGTTAGGTTAGETTAGETTAGETTAGETTAGETTAGESNLVDDDNDRFSPPEDCNDQEATINPEAVEVCDGLDNDCDEQIDEAVLNACGQCGDLPSEVCDGSDNDCDGQTDEGVLNACGECGAVPAEVCDDFDNDCDGQTDEGVLNACGECGAVPVESCDGSDNDCDGQVDEGTLNACGQCGAVPAEVCDGSDNDCDGRSDEGVTNACGRCGPIPSEVCDGRDNDCDGQSDEGVTNACGQCGIVPNEVCDGLDNDCDGEADEGVLNACGQCGQVPQEACDGQDNDCDGTVDEGLTINICGTCGALPIEVCDGQDNDCDDQIDEDLASPCFTLKHTIEASDEITEMGNFIKIVGDLDGDGINDALLRSERFGRVRVLAYSGNGSLLWSVEGDGLFAIDITGGRFFGGTDYYVAISDPDSDRVIIYNNSGAPYVILNVAEGSPYAIETLRGNRDTLVYSVPFADQGGLIRRLRFNSDNPSNPNVVYSTFGDPDEISAERIFTIGDLIGNGAEDLIFTQSLTRPSGDEDIGTVLMDGSSGRALSGSRFTPPQNTYSSFAYDIAVGSFDPMSNRSFAYGAPLVSERFEDQGAVYFLHESFDGYSTGSPLFGGVDNSGIGLQLETLTRLSASADTLVIGGFGELTYRDFSSNGQRVPVPLPSHNLYLGLGLAIDETPTPDGTYLMWVSGLSEVAGESRVWILRAR